MVRHGLLLRLLGTLCVFAVFYVGGLEGFRHTITDARFKIAARPATGKVVLVEIDGASLQSLGPWPWSRSVYATILDKLQDAGATDVGFDVDFSAVHDAAGDRDFARALDRAGGEVVLAALQQRDGPSAAGLIVNHPLPAFLKAAWEASVNVYPDDDGVIRILSRGSDFGKASLPFLMSGLTGETAGTYMVDYGIDRGGIDRLSAAEVYAGRFDPRRVRDKNVIVGASALELRDFYQVPRYGVIPGALLQSLGVDALLQGRDLQPVDPAVPLTICIAILTLAWLARKLDMSLAILLAAAVAASVEAAAIVLQRVAPLVLDTSLIHVELLTLTVLAVMLEIDSRRIKILVSRGNAERLRAILDHVVADNFAGIVVVDQNGILRALSRAAADLLGVAEDMAGGHAAQILPPELQEVLRATQQMTASGTPLSPMPRQLEVRLRPLGDPTVIEYVTTVSTIPGSVAESGKKIAAQQVVCLTFQDVTERRRSEAHIERLAHFDTLTGLANRHSFLPRFQSVLEGWTADRGCLAILFVDLDRFKVVNDRLGNTCGDALLKRVAERIAAATRPGDIVARLGSDEFALMVVRTDAAEATRFADQLVSGLSGVYELDAYQVMVCVSAGLAFAQNCPADDLMKRADTALSAAKISGGGCARVFDDALAEIAEAGRVLEHDLRDAIRRNELQVFYQRQVDAVTETIIGVEALVRWKHPRLGYVPPAKFIPIAERTGIVDEIGAWVLRAACQDAMSWPTPIKVSVNLSVVQLSRGDLVQTVASALEDSGLPPERLDLELTESLLLENAGFARGVLDRVRQLGVGLSLDDFGTGYSSLAYLKNFDIDKIKIDRSFVKDLPDDQSSIAIIRAVVTLAQTLGIRVNTEGVETIEQLRLLRALGCDEIQGFLHGRPEPSAAIAGSLQAMAMLPLAS